MPNRKSAFPPAGSDTRTRVLAAAEHLLGQGQHGFSMRELAAAAGVSFATPFNLFGSKGAIVQALSAERIDRMTTRFGAAPPASEMPTRVLAAVDVAVAVMLETPEASRAVMGALGSPGQAPGEVSQRSRALWALALGNGEGLAPDTADLACAILPDQLAAAFRGVLSFWSAGEMADTALQARARQAAAALLLGFTHEQGRARLIQILQEAE